jgi:UDP-GlcNAc:undecaprenyl-phosphate GlcNAc-1-phosphate transferase
MSFPFNVYGLAFATAGAVTLLSMPLWRRWCLRAGHVDDPGHRKIHDQPVALAGGLALLTGWIVPLLAGAVLIAAVHLPRDRFGPVDPIVLQLFGYGFSRRIAQLAAIFSGAAGMVLLGWIDDRRELGAAKKFSGQVLIAALVAASGIRITLFVDNALFSYGVTILWIVTVTNACNFMDNMNGLCAGLGLIATWCFAWTAAINGQYLVASIAFSACGALLGFLPFNFPKATAFLGDAGSHLVGYLLSILAILPHFYSRRAPDTLAVLKPLLILIVFLGDLVWVVTLRLQAGKPFYEGDTNHLSHRLVRRGFTRTRAVLLIWLLSAIAGALSFQ